ncbi:MAG: GNAT family N-acetyltransferase [Methanocella sp.]
MLDYQIRPVRVEDAEAVNELRRQPGVMEFTYAIPTERVAESRKYFESLGPNDHVLVVEVAGRVVGIGGLHVQTGKRRHLGTVGISIHDDFQGQGLGRALMTALLDLADNYLGLRRVQLDTWADNARAIHLYESLGFEVEGRQREAVYRRGEYLDLILMARLRR